MKGMQEKNLPQVWGTDRKSVPQDHSLTWLGKPRDARQLTSGRIFLSTPHTHDRFLYSHMGKKEIRSEQLQGTEKE